MQIDYEIVETMKNSGDLKNLVSLQLPTEKIVCMLGKRRYGQHKDRYSGCIQRASDIEFSNN